MNYRAQAKFGSYIFLLLVLLSVFVAAQHSIQTDQNSKASDNNSLHDVPMLQENPAMNLRIASPVFGEKIAGTGIVIVSVAEPQKITSAFFKIGSIHGELSVQNNFSSEFDSLQLENGDYNFSVQACIEESCATTFVPISVQNTQITPDQNTFMEPDANTFEVPDTNTPAEPDINAGEEIDANAPVDVFDENVSETPEETVSNKVTVSGSNIFSTLTLFNLGGSIAASGTDNIEVLSGIYDAQIDFFDSVISTTKINGLALDSNKEILQINEVNSVPDDNTSIENNFFAVLEIKTSFDFENTVIEFNFPPNFDKLYSCSNWDFESKKCAVEFTLETLSQAEQFETHSKEIVFGFARKQIPVDVKDEFEEIQPDQNVLSVPREKKIAQATSQLESEAQIVPQGRNPSAKRLFMDSDCGDTLFSNIESDGYVYRLENKCLIADFKIALESVRIYSHETNQIFGWTPQAIEEFEPGENNAVLDSIEFSSNPFEPEFIAIENILNTQGFENGSLAWSFNYNGSDIHIYFDLVRSQLKWGLEVKDWNYSSPKSELRIKQKLSGDFEEAIFEPLEQKVEQSYSVGEETGQTEASAQTNSNVSRQKIVLLTDQQNNSRAIARFAEPLNDSVPFESVLSMQQENNYTLLFQSLGRGKKIELDPTLSVESDSFDGYVRYNSQFLTYTPSTTDILAGYTRPGSRLYDRAIFSFSLTGLGSVSAATFYLDYQSTPKAETSGTFDLLSIADVGASIDQTDFSSSSFETVIDNWFNCTTIAGDVSTSVATAWNNAITGSRSYLDFRLFLDDDTSRLAGTVECQVDFYDTGEGGTNPYIDYTLVPTEDYTFALNLPSSGCTQGEGSTDAGADCEIGYFEAATNYEYKIDAQGQTSSIPFFVYDNQSTAENDMNITMDLNAALGSNLKLKAAQAYGGYASFCSGNAKTGCVQIDKNGSYDFYASTPLEDVDIYFNSASNYNHRAYIKFDITGIPRPATVNTAKLGLSIISFSELDDHDYTFYHIDLNQNWYESDGYSNLWALQTGTFFSATNCYSIDIADQNCTISSVVSASVNAGDANFSFRMEDPDANSNAPNTSSSESATSLQIGNETFSSTLGFVSKETPFVNPPPKLFVNYSLGEQTLGTATYSAGTKDLNIFVWGDFDGTTGGTRQNRLARSNSVPTT